MPGPDQERFMVLVAEAVDTLPDWILGTLDNVEILVDDEPPAGERDLLGLYHGIPLTDRGSNYTNVLPDTITLFSGPIIRQSRGGDERLRSIVRHTVAHEVAHHFGISDERLLEIDAY